MLKPASTQGEGLGSCRFSNGNTYEGSFHDGIISGLGVYMFVSKGSYAGQVSMSPCQRLH